MMWANMLRLFRVGARTPPKTFLMPPWRSTSRSSKLSARPASRRSPRAAFTAAFGDATLRCCPSSSCGPARSASHHRNQPGRADQVRVIETADSLCDPRTCRMPPRSRSDRAVARPILPLHRGIRASRPATPAHQSVDQSSARVTPVTRATPITRLQVAADRPAGRSFRAHWVAAE